MDPTADDERDAPADEHELDEHELVEQVELFDEVPAVLEVYSEDVVANARRRYGTGGALLAAGMLGVDKILSDRKKPDSVQVQEAASEPVDVDKSGIQVMIDELTSVEAPPLERREPLSMKKKRSRRR